jgi:hypothetical protein
MRIRALVLPLAVAAAFLAGCTQAGSTPSPTPTSNGIDALDAAAILTKANDALNKAGSYHIAGSATSEGQKVDVDVVFAGDNFKGKFGLLGLSIDLMTVGGTVYMKADSLLGLMGLAGTQSPQMTALANTVKGKYIAVPAGEAAQFADVPNADELLGFKDGTFTKGETTTLDGKSVLTLSNSKGTKLYVARTGEPYPVQVEYEGGAVLKVTDIGTASAITAPAAADVIDYTQLMGQINGAK